MKPPGEGSDLMDGGHVRGRGNGAEGGEQGAPSRQVVWISPPHLAQREVRGNPEGFGAGPAGIPSALGEMIILEAAWRWGSPRGCRQSPVVGF